MVIVGSGPAGMMLAAELTLAGVDVVVVERRPTQRAGEPPLPGLHARTLEVLDQRGIADRFLAAGQPMQVQAFAGIPLDISDFPTRHNHGLALLQSEFERIMVGWIEELGVRILRERDVVGHVQDEDAVEVTCADGTVLRGAYLVGCDGSRSVVRKTAGIDFAGWDPTVCWITAEVEVDRAPPFGTAWRWRGRTGRGGTRRRHPRRARGSRQPVPRTDARRPASRAGPGRRDRPRRPQPALHLALHRHDPAGRHLPRRTGPARR